MTSISKKIYFASDQHFGAPTPELSFPREQKFVAWLDEVKKDAEAIFLLGDLFDFWFEYKTVVPKGFVRVLGKLAEIRDSGIPIYFFVGNHDLWMNDYFEKELTDCYVATANGPGISYHYNAFYVRIDNIMCSDHWKPYECKVDNSISASDHYPIVCKLQRVK
jgi:UDP-2,3-diacylglucosamine pyrophosphatase LpxH